MEKNTGYTVEVYPTEWLVFLHFHEKVPVQIRKAIAKALDDSRQALAKAAPFAQPAYSLTPSDRPFGMTSGDYDSLRQRFPDVDCSALDPGAALTIDVMDESANLPLFVAARKAIEDKCPFVRFKTFTRREFGERLANADAIISPLGQSPADPLPNLGILARTRPGLQSILEKDELANIAAQGDAQEFSKRVLELHRRIHEHRLIVPLFHFPGVVVSSKRLTRIEKLSFNWGIQAWAYKVR